MTARHLRRGLYFICVVFTCLVLASTVLAFAQGASLRGGPLRIGPLTVTVPAGWTTRPNGESFQVFSPDSTLQQYLMVELFPPQETTQGVREHHAQILTNLAAFISPRVQPQNGVLGQFIWTKFELQRPTGAPETMVLYSAKAGSLYVGISADATSADILNRNLPTLEAMVRGAAVSNAPGATGSSALMPDSGAPNSGAANTSAGNSAGSGPVGSMATLNDYVFAMPPGWTGTKYSDGLVLMSPVSVTNERCVVTLWPMRQAGPNLLNDAINAFRDVYKAYELRNMTTRGTAMPASIVHGTSGQGWDYVVIKRGVAPRGSPESRLGFVFVARLNDRLAVVSGVSKDPLVSTCMGELASNFWPRFFYSLSFRNWTPTDQSAAMRKRMAGAWTTATASAADQIVFAGNGRYANAAAAQQYYRVSSTELLTTTQAYFGKGAYTLRGNAITLTQDDRKNQPDNGFVRVEGESKDEGRTWTEILYLLRVSAIDGKDYEVSYKKQ